MHKSIAVRREDQIKNSLLSFGSFSISGVGTTILDLSLFGRRVSLGKGCKRYYESVDSLARAAGIEDK